MHERTLLLGGDMQIESEPHQGSRLAVELPLHQGIQPVVNEDHTDDHNISRG
jgi:signal transduction histidine kinase